MNRFLLIRNIEAACYPHYSTEDWENVFETYEEARAYAILDRGGKRWPSHRYYIVDLKELLETGVVPEGERLDFLEKEIKGGRE